MKKSQRLKVIVDLNADNEKKALQELGIVQTKKGELEKQLENLEQYRQEYKDQYQSISEAGVNIAKLLEFRSFISKLDKVIED
ncbi:MAG: flagellar FliJ family protein, partial [Methylococcales bacterium]|nr:flagellar FliJ family protein [Methylococcales bacterium]